MLFRNSAHNSYIAHTVTQSYKKKIKKKTKGWWCKINVISLICCTTAVINILMRKYIFTIYVYSYTV